MIFKSDRALHIYKVRQNDALNAASEVVGIFCMLFQNIEKKDNDILLKIINGVLDSTEFPTKEKKETQRKVWKRVIGKSMLSKKEALALMGFFKKMMRKR